jgi:hypothetical protein
MILQIFEHTPTWVFVLLAVLLALGLVQTRTRDVGKARAIGLPVAMMLLSLNGALGAFTQPAFALVAWVAGFALSLVLAGPVVAVRGASWSAATSCFRVPGSWLPLGLILGLFIIKYAAGIALATHHGLASSTVVTVSLSAVYGIFAGMFWGRARSLLTLTRTSAAGAQAA